MRAYSRGCIAVILCILIFVTAEGSVQTDFLAPVSNPIFADVTYTIHSPIVITHQDNFSQLGFAGSGSESEPYIIENLNITTDGDCVSVSDTSVHFTIRQCLLTSSTIRNGSGIFLEHTDNATVEDCKISEKQWGIRLRWSEKCDLHNNLLFNNSWNGILATYTSDCVIEYNEIFQNSRHGLYLGVTDSLVAHNIIRNNSLSGAYLEFSYDTLLYNNTVFWNGEFAIDAPYGSRVNITHSRIYQNRYGISTSVSGNIMFNNVSNNGYRGIGAYGTRWVTISNNLVVGNGDNGIHLSDTQESEVTHNTILHNEEHGMLLSRSNTVDVEYNLIERNGGSGVLWRDGNQWDYIRYNEIRYNNGSGVYLNDCWSGVTVKQNNLSYNNGAGVFFDEYSQQNSIHENLIEFNKYGVNISADSHHNWVRENDFVENLIYNVHDDGASNTFSENYYSNYTGSDEDNDGFGDIPHPISGLANNSDLSPRVYPSGVTPPPSTSSTTSQTTGTSSSPTTPPTGNGLPNISQAILIGGMVTGVVVVALVFWLKRRS